MGEVLIKCTGSRLEDWKKLKNFQGDLKELSKENYEKLKWRILTKGFKAPFFVWKGHDYLLDGLQRSRALAGLEDDGHTVPARLPVVDIIAETKAEAKDDLLGFVSQYGHPTEEGLYKFLNDVPDLDWDEIVKSVDIPDIDLAQFEEGWIKDGNGKGGLTDDDEIRRTLAERFIIPPFSILDARQGYWQDRKRAWIALGLKGELGRGGGRNEQLQKSSQLNSVSEKSGGQTLGAIPPNEKDILKRSGKYGKK